MIYYGFIMPDGTERPMTDDARLHGDLALKIIREEGYNKDFRKSDITDPVDFLVLEIGAIKVGNQAKSDSVTVKTPIYEPMIRGFVKLYQELGYRIDRISY